MRCIHLIPKDLGIRSHFPCAMHLPECLVCAEEGRSISHGVKEQEKGRNAFSNAPVQSFIHFFFSFLSSATGKHVRDVLVLKAVAHSFIELFHVISQFALDIPETIDNRDRKLQARLTYNSLLALFSVLLK